MNGRRVDTYGTHRFIGSNCISLEIRGFRLKLTNTVRVFRIKDSSLARIPMQPKIWKISDDGKMLEEVEYFGDGAPEMFFKEPR
jgi:hypothetical protein